MAKNKGNIGLDTKRNLIEIAEEDFKYASCMVIRAFNLCDDHTVPWQFPADTRQSAEALIRSLYDLFHTSELQPNHAFARGEAGATRAEQAKQEALIKQAHGDPQFKRFLGKLNVGQTPPAT